MRCPCCPRPHVGGTGLSTQAVEALPAQGTAAPGLSGQHPLCLTPFQPLLGNGRLAGQEPSVPGSPLLSHLTPLVISSQNGRKKKQKQKLSQGPEPGTPSPLLDPPPGPARWHPPPHPCLPCCQASWGTALPGREQMAAVTLGWGRHHCWSTCWDSRCSCPREPATYSGVVLGTMGMLANFVPSSYKGDEDAQRHGGDPRVAQGTRLAAVLRPCPLL